MTFTAGRSPPNDYYKWQILAAERQTLEAGIAHALTFGVAITLSIVTLVIATRRLLLDSHLCLDKQHDEYFNRRSSTTTGSKDPLDQWSTRRKTLYFCFLYAAILFALTLSYYLPLIVSIANHKTLAVPGYGGYWERYWEPRGGLYVVSMIIWRVVMIMADSVLACVLHRAFRGYKRVQHFLILLYGLTILGTIVLLLHVRLYLFTIIYEAIASSLLLLLYIKQLHHHHTGQHWLPLPQEVGEGEGPTPKLPASTVSGSFLLAVVLYVICRTLWTVSAMSYNLENMRVWTNALMFIGALVLQHVFIIIENAKTDEDEDEDNDGDDDRTPNPAVDSNVAEERQPMLQSIR